MLCVPGRVIPESLDRCQPGRHLARRGDTASRGVYCGGTVNRKPASPNVSGSAPRSLARTGRPLASASAATRPNVRRLRALAAGTAPAADRPDRGRDTLRPGSAPGRHRDQIVRQRIAALCGAPARRAASGTASPPRNAALCGAPARRRPGDETGCFRAGGQVKTRTGYRGGAVCSGTA